MIPQKLGALQVKHLVQVTVCVLAIYLLRVRRSYQFTPAWRNDLDVKHYQNGKFPVKDELLPAPIITDLDGDSSMEIVFVKNDFNIEVARTLSPAEGGVRLSQTVPQFTERLPTITTDDGSLARPVVMETGYLDPYVSEDQTRNQVIVLLYSNWHLVCYDHELRLLWQQQAMAVDSALAGDYEVQSMTILVTPHSVHKEDRGLVIVGGNFQHMGHQQEQAHPLDMEDDDVEAAEAEDAAFTKFSTLAFDGGNGTLRWYHLPGSGDYKSAPTQDIHHWKLSLKRGHWPHGKVHWSRFGTYLLKHTPHHWSSLQHTSMDLANIRRFTLDDPTSLSPDISANAGLSEIVELPSEHVAGIPHGGLPPHSRHEHVSSPNAAVIHHALGLQVLSLLTGQLITDLRLDNPDAVYADINNDANLDQVKVNFAGECRGEASTIHPRPRALFSVEICQMESWWTGVSYEQISEDTHLSVPPIVVKSIARSRGVLNHLLGKSLSSERKGYDSIFLTSSGRLTSVGHQGQLNWKVTVPARWSERTRAAAYPLYHTTAEGAVYYHGFTPSLTAHATQVYGPETSALILGWEHIAMVNLEDGYVEAQHSLPCQPLRPPVIADFNSDGLNDVIVSCPSGYVGLSVQPQPQYVYMSLLSVTIMMVILLLSWCCQIDGDGSHDSDDEDYST